MVRPFLVVQMPDTSDERTMSLTLRPFNGFSLSVRGRKYVIHVILYHVVRNWASFRTSFRSVLQHKHWPCYFSLITSYTPQRHRIAIGSPTKEVLGKYRGLLRETKDAHLRP